MVDVEDGLAEDRGRHPAPVGGGSPMAVYAAAAGLAAAVPVPFVDSALGGLARGAALRRVASRHGVRLAGEAREILSRPLAAERSRSWGASVVRRSLARIAAPLRIAVRLEDALMTCVAALLLDHYLATADRERGAPIGVDEARRLRGAIEHAAVAGAAGSLREAPGRFWTALREALRAAATPDPEDRSPAERLVDALLDAAADAPGEMGERMRAAFDDALGRGR